MTARSAERTAFLADVLEVAAHSYPYAFFRLDDYVPRESAVITEQVWDDACDNETHPVDLDTIARGFAVARDPDTTFVDPELRRTIVAADRANDAGEIGAIEALVVLEFGLYGAVLYS